MRHLLALSVRMGGLGLVNPVNQSQQEYEASIKATGPLVKRIAKQAVEPRKDEDVAGAQRCARQEKADSAQRDLEYVTSWLSIIPLKEMSFNPTKREFRDAIKLRYGWEFNDMPTMCVCWDFFDADHAMIGMRRGFIIQRHNEIRDLEAGFCK